MVGSFVLLLEQKLAFSELRAFPSGDTFTEVNAGSLLHPWVTMTPLCGMSLIHSLVDESDALNESAYVG